MASGGYSGAGSDSCPSTDHNLEVVTADGEFHGALVVPCAGKMEDFIERLGLDKEDAAAECVMLLHGDRRLPRANVLQDCGLVRP